MGAWYIWLERDLGAKMTDYQILLQEYGIVAQERATFKVVAVQKETEIRELKSKIEDLEKENKELREKLGVKEDGTE